MNQTLTPAQLELRAKWTAALRSGAYQQTRNRLRKTDGFCCLGVLCDVIDPSRWGRLAGNTYAFTGGTPEGLAGVSCRPPKDIAEAVGMEDAFDYDLEGRSFFLQLMTMNDCKGFTFADIADHIDADTAARMAVTS